MNTSVVTLMAIPLCRMHSGGIRQWWICNFVAACSYNVLHARHSLPSCSSAFSADPLGLLCASCSTYLSLVMHANCNLSNSAAPLLMKYSSFKYAGQLSQVRLALVDSTVNVILGRAFGGAIVRVRVTLWRRGTPTSPTINTIDPTTYTLTPYGRARTG